MKGLMRLYPESPIVPCEYDDIERVINPFGFKLMRPYTPNQRRDATWDLAFALGLPKFLARKDIVFFTVFHAMSKLYVHKDGIVEYESNYEFNLETTGRYVNKFNDAPFYPDSERVKVALMPTFQPISICYTEPAYLLYFPKENMMFDGLHHYQRTDEPITPIQTDNIKDDYRRLIKEE